MPIPEPKPGLVIRYENLWRTEAMRGAEQGAKVRPCVVVLAIRKEGGRIEVMVAPITHAAPRDGVVAIEVPVEAKRRLGLDDERSWVVTSDVNLFDWPGPDIRPAGRGGGGGGSEFAYGYLDRALVEVVQGSVRALFRRRMLRPVRRD